MSLTKETKWLCENARNLEQFSGQWITFCPTDGMLSNGKSLDEALKMAHRKRHAHKPFVFLVPSKDQLDSPVLSMAAAE